MNKRVVFETIRENPGLRTSGIVALLADGTMPRRRIEDVIYELWRDREIQINPDSTLRVTHPDERVFRTDF